MSEGGMTMLSRYRASSWLSLVALLGLALVHSVHSVTIVFPQPDAACVGSAEETALFPRVRANQVFGLPSNLQGLGASVDGIVEEDGLVVIGAPKTNNRAGAVVVLQAKPLPWSALGVITTTNTASSSGAEFGSWVAIDGSLIIVGAPRDRTNNLADAGAAFVFRYVWDVVSDAFTYTEEAVLKAPSPAAEDQFGERVAIHGPSRTAVVACKNCDYDGLGNAGLVFVYRSLGLNQAWSLFQTIRQPAATSSARFGIALSLQWPFLAIGGMYDARSNGEVFLFEHNTPDDPLLFSLTNPWQLAVGPIRPSPWLQAAEYGFSVALHGTYLAVGAPGSTVGSTTGQKTGAAYVYNITGAASARAVSTPWVLTPEGDFANLEFGYSISINGDTNFISVGAPGENRLVSPARPGSIYMFRPSLATGNSSAVPQLRVVLSSNTEIGGQRFGEGLFQAPTRAIVGAPSSGSGVLFEYSGSEFFPIPQPVFEPEGGSLLLKQGTTFNISFIPDDPDSTVYYEVNSTRQISVNSHVYTTPLVYTSGINVYTVYAISELDAFTSLPKCRLFRTYLPVPGYFWTADTYYTQDFEGILQACGATRFYCPGTFEDPYRHQVDLGYYSIPRENDPDKRWGQRPCEPEHICIEGFRTGCNRPICWPLLVSAVAAEGGDNEEGLGNGDTITLTFNVETNRPYVHTTEFVNALLNFSEPIGSKLKGEWLSDTVMLLTIEDATNAGDPFFTSVGMLHINILATGGLKLKGNLTQPTQTSTGIVLQGTWGKVLTPPRLIEAEAFGSDVGDHGYGPGLHDSLLLRFDLPIPWISVADKPTINRIFMFDPPLDDVQYYGKWISFTELMIYFTEYYKITSVADNIPSWHRADMMVGRLQVAPAPNGIRSRDNSSDPSPSVYITVDRGTWGDTVDILTLTLLDETSLDINFLPTGTPLDPNTVTGYLVQVLEDMSFEEWETSSGVEVINGTAREIPLYLNVTVPRDPSKEVEPRQEYTVSLTGLNLGSYYYVRAFVLFGSRRGPPLLSSPPRLWMFAPTFVKVLRGVQIPTTGQNVIILITNVGQGDKVAALPVEGRMVGGSSSTNVTAQCHMDRNGIHVRCDVPPGVGGGYQWSLRIGGSNMSPSKPLPDQTTSYYAPYITGVVFIQQDQLGYLPMDVTGYIGTDGGIAPGHSTRGGERVRIIGYNFGRVEDNALDHVKYYSIYDPNQVYEADNCSIVRDHVEINCEVLEGAGAGLVWNVTVAKQGAEMMRSYYATPQVLNISHDYAETGIPTAGGALITIYGRQFGPARPEVVPVLGCAPFSLLRATGTGIQSPPSPYWNLFDGELGDARFITDRCAIVKNQTMIECESPPGFGTQIACAVHLLGLTSPPEVVDSLYYTPPSLYNLARIRVFTRSSIVNGQRITTTITEVVKRSMSNSTLYPIQVPTRGSDIPVAVYGTNFAPIYQSSAMLYIDGNRVPRVDILNDGELRFYPPPGVGSNLTLFAIVGGQVSNTLYFSYQAPFVTQVSLAYMEWFYPRDDYDWERSRRIGVQEDGQGRVWLPCLYVEGGNFGGEEGEDSFVAELSSSECYEERNITHTDFICCIDISSGSLVVEVGGQISEPAEVRTENLDRAPHIEAAMPTNGLTSGGYEVTLYGTGFRTGRVYVLGLGVSYPGTTNVSSISQMTRLEAILADHEGDYWPHDTNITFRVPQGQGPRLIITVERYSALGLGILTSIPFEWSYQPPAVSSVSPIQFLSAGGVLTLQGKSFGLYGRVLLKGLTQADLEALADNTTDPNTILPIQNRDYPEQCSPILTWTHTQIQCVILSSRAQEGPVAIDVGWFETEPLYPGVVYQKQAEQIPDYFTPKAYTASGIIAQVQVPPPPHPSGASMASVSLLALVIVLLGGLWRF